jgi:hypothetical protein
MGAERCAAPGCGRFVSRKTRWCARHVDLFDELVDESPGLDERAAEFERRLAQGDYRYLFGQVLREIVEQAAEVPGLADEIGVLRVVLARLMVEERDPKQLAESVSRVAAVAIQAARAQRAISGDQADGLTGALTQILMELDAGALLATSYEQ